jgi:hypothetical protein
MKILLQNEGKEYLFFLLLFLSFGFSNSFAQDRSFDEISIGLNFSNNFNKETLHDYWKPGNSYEAYLRTPIQFGNVQAGLLYTSFKSKNTEQPDFKGTFIYLQWDKEIFTKSNFEINAGIKFGMFRMVFDKTELYYGEDEIQEHEIFAGLAVSANYKLTQNAGFSLSANYNSILTHKKINLFFVGAGFYYTFDTPLWLKDFLK